MPLMISIFSGIKRFFFLIQMSIFKFFKETFSMPKSIYIYVGEQSLKNKRERRDLYAWIFESHKINLIMHK